MTPTERRHCLEVLGWSQRELARRLGWDEGTVRRWMRHDGEAPPEVDVWLQRYARFVESHPPPERQPWQPPESAL